MDGWGWPGVPGAGASGRTTDLAGIVGSKVSPVGRPLTGHLYGRVPPPVGNNKEEVGASSPSAPTEEFETLPRLEPGGRPLYSRPPIGWEGRRLWFGARR